MKDSEFTELLNLYLDHEITPADAARLEAEVQSNPARRRVYQDYCRMQKACKMLAEDFATEPAADRSVIAFEQASASRGRSKLVYFTGGLAAAAACVALIFVGRHREEVAPATGPVFVQNQQPQTAAPAQFVAATMPAQRETERPMNAALSLRSSAQSDALALTPAVQNDPHFAWMQDVRLAPMQMPNPVDQLRLEVSPALRTENRTYNSSKPLPADVPWVAIRFQK